ncbi:glycosyltransferase [Xylophilus rhododendri]|uniref:Glycosyltransferase n=1 Tax=Xylophilus rhododendri TaxID=2697032 RepID=A0A857JB80_9BURK|nr:glycosyltransferase [Xylophilus rhododendri]QHI99975.1 glycosyltransferase [Xylophilus rhododendri]
MPDLLAQNIDSQGFPSACRVSIVIKALNEERRIEKAVSSALTAVASIGGEVVLADSCSSDRTVELASRFPIRIVQLAAAAERCCGIGPQLGYQHAFGEYVYILDGDMEMLPDFLPQAVAYMDRHPEVGGVGGRIIEMNTSSLEYLARMERASSHMAAGDVDRLDMGGLYRRNAIEEAGYFSDRNLHSYEELDLAIRMRAKGWRLVRIDVPSVTHHGHDAPPYALLRKRWKTGYICGLGELVRASWGQPQMPFLWRDVRELRLYIGVMVWWAVLVLLALWPMPVALKCLALLAVALGPWVLMGWRKKSFRKATFSVVSWAFNVAGLLRGMLRARTPPVRPVDSVVVQEPPAHAGIS